MQASQRRYLSSFLDQVRQGVVCVRVYGESRGEALDRGGGNNKDSDIDSRQDNRRRLLRIV